MAIVLGRFIPSTEGLQERISAIAGYELEIYPFHHTMEGESGVSVIEDVKIAARKTDAIWFDLTSVGIQAQYTCPCGCGDMMYASARGYTFSELKIVMENESFFNKTTFVLFGCILEKSRAREYYDSIA